MREQRFHLGLSNARQVELIPRNHKGENDVSPTSQKQTYSQHSDSLVVSQAPKELSQSDSESAGKH